MHVIKVYGPPGTGKTTWLEAAVERERKGGVPLHRMAYLSFTKSAREVIKSRMDATEADMRWFRTLHGACTKQLGLGQTIITPYDYRHFSELTGMKVSAEDGLDYSWSADQPLDYNITLRALNLAATTMCPIQEVLRDFPVHRNLTRTNVDLFDKKWRDYKEQVGRFDYMDMLTKFHAEGQPIDIDVGFIDEAQDLTLLQWLIAHKLLAKAKRIYMAGDDDQAIYTFIGASEYGFLDHPCDEELVLSQSWRVPHDIGEVAEQIIKRVPHRKQKDVTWRDEKGSVKRANLDAMTLPWRGYLEKFETILVLTRHRAGALQFSNDLKMVGVPHTLHGDAVQSWKEAKLLHAYMTLKNGGSITPHAAQELCDELGVRSDKLRDLKRRSKVTAEVLALDYKSPWQTIFMGADKKKRRRYETLAKLVNKQGAEALIAAPKIAINTMHGAKGKEADLVIISPDCNNTVRQHLLTPAEIRLSYVALTRAKHDCLILMPRSDTYINHFFGG